jgi:hypothetical protein
MAKDRIDINEEHLLKYAMAQCELDELSELYRKKPKQIKSRYHGKIARQKALGILSLRLALFDEAINKRNPTILKMLAENYLSLGTKDENHVKSKSVNVQINAQKRVDLTRLSTADLEIIHKMFTSIDPSNSSPAEREPIDVESITFEPKRTK